MQYKIKQLTSSVTQISFQFVILLLDLLELKFAYIFPQVIN